MNWPGDWLPRGAKRPVTRTDLFDESECAAHDSKDPSGTPLGVRMMFLDSYTQGGASRLKPLRLTLGFGV
jgi:hypothetical protein